MKRISDQLREAIEQAPISRYRLAQLTGLDQGLLSRFVHGRCGLAMESIDRVAECLGLELRHAQSEGRKHGKHIT